MIFSKLREFNDLYDLPPMTSLIQVSSIPGKSRLESLVTKSNEKIELIMETDGY